MSFAQGIRSTSRSAVCFLSIDHSSECPRIVHRPSASGMTAAKLAIHSHREGSGEPTDSGGFFLSRHNLRLVQSVHSCRVHIWNSYSTPFSVCPPLGTSMPAHTRSSSCDACVHCGLPSGHLNSLNSGKNVSQSSKDGERMRVMRMRSAERWFLSFAEA